MPLSVYESPLMHYYRRFRQMRKNSDSDGHYIVQKRRITSRNTQEKPIEKSDSPSIQNSIDMFVNEEDNDYNDNEIMLLYGRGPVFEMHDEYSDRFEGFDD